MKKSYLVLNLAIFCAYTRRFLLAPMVIAKNLGIVLTSNTALADFRALYGGMCLGVGTVFCLGIRRQAWEIYAIWLAVWTAAGLLLGRIMMLVNEGPAVLFNSFSMACETVSTGIGVYLLAGVLRQAR